MVSEWSPHVLLVPSPSALSICIQQCSVVFVVGNPTLRLCIPSTCPGVIQIHIPIIQVQHPCYRYYSKGLLASPFVTYWDASSHSLLTTATWPWYTYTTALHLLADYPARRWADGAFPSVLGGVKPHPVRAASQAYNTCLAHLLWEVSAKVVGVPEDVAGEAATAGEPVSV